MLNRKNNDDIDNIIFVIDQDKFDDKDFEEEDFEDIEEEDLDDDDEDWEVLDVTAGY